MFGTGVVKEDGTYYLDFTYTIDDPFDGVLSGVVGGVLGIQEELEKIIGEVDVPGCSPYNMTAEWYSIREDKFQ